MNCLSVRVNEQIGANYSTEGEGQHRKKAHSHWKHLFFIQLSFCAGLHDTAGTAQSHLAPSARLHPFPAVLQN